MIIVTENVIANLIIGGKASPAIKPGINATIGK